MPEPAVRVQGETVAAACAAPWSALYFRPDGHVATCCGSWHLLGRVTGPDRRSLRELWDGAELAQLRAAMEAHDYGLGCWECGRQAGAGDRAGSLAADFDRYAAGLPARYPQLLDLALSNRCNLQCVMCNGGLSSSIRRHREGREPLPSAYDDRFFAELDEFLPHARRLQFKGGEPFLARENRRIWDRLIELGGRREVCVTTNGTIWNRNVERYVDELAMEVILSVDAMDPGVLSAVRVGTDPDALWANVDRFRAATERNGTHLTLAMCLMSDTWQELGAFLAEVDRRDLRADVIWVDGPARFNLLTQPPEMLADAARALEAESPRRAGLRADLRALWEDAVERVAAAAARPAPAATAVSIDGRRDWRAEVATWRAELRRGAVIPDLVELEYEHDVIRRVDVPDWAAFLDPDAWVGTGLDETMAVVAAAAGTTVRSEVESLTSGVHRARLTLGTGPAARVLDACLVPGPAGSGESRLLIALAAAPSGDTASSTSTSTSTSPASAPDSDSADGTGTPA